MLFSRKVVRGLLSTTVAAAALAVPAVSSADTPVPPLQAGDTQAYPSLTAGGPVITSPIVRHHSGTLNVDFAPTVHPCSTTLTSTINPDGTAAVTQASFSPTCLTTNQPGCYANVTTPSGTPGLSWGGRLVRDSSGTFRLRINIQKFTITWMGICPYVPTGIPFSAGGVLSPQVGSGSGSGVASRTTLTFAKTSGVMHWDFGDNGFYPYLAGSLFAPVGEPLFAGV